MRVMGLDVGDRRIGVALSDPTGLIASPLTTIIRVAEKADHEAVRALAVEHQAGLIVVGLPLTLAGEIGRQAERVTKFAEGLSRVVDVPVVYWDERHSTSDAERIVRSRGRRRAKQGRGERLDHVAAAVILQFYLDSHRHS